MKIPIIFDFGKLKVYVEDHWFVGAGHLNLKLVEGALIDVATLIIHKEFEKIRRDLNARDPQTLRPPYSDEEMMKRVQQMLAEEEKDGTS